MKNYTIKKDNKGFYFVDKNNKDIFQKRFKYIYEPKNGFVIVEDNKGRFYIDSNGVDVFKKRFDYAFNFYEGLALVEDKKGWYFIDKKGSDVFQKRFINAWSFNNGAAKVKDSKGWYFIDKKGVDIFQKRFDYIDDFKDGFFKVEKNGVDYYLDKKGNLTTGRLINSKNFNKIEDFRYNDLFIFEQLSDKQQIELLKYFDYLNSISDLHNSEISELCEYINDSINSVDNPIDGKFFTDFLEHFCFVKKDDKEFFIEYNINDLDDYITTSNYVLISR